MEASWCWVTILTMCSHGLHKAQREGFSLSIRPELGQLKWGSSICSQAGSLTWPASSCGLFVLVPIYMGFSIWLSFPHNMVVEFQRWMSQEWWKLYGFYDLAQEAPYHCACHIVLVKGPPRFKGGRDIYLGHKPSWDSGKVPNEHRRWEISQTFLENAIWHTF